LDRLFRGVFEINMGRCPNRGGELKIIAANLAQPVIEKILMHLEQAPRRGVEGDSCA
jgi:hypothetical protein